MSTIWKASLDGENASLLYLAHQFTGPELSVIKEGDVFHLTSTDFNSLDEDEDVYRRAGELVEIANGVGRMKLHEAFRAISLGAATVRDRADGARSVTIRIPTAVAIAFANDPTIIGAHPIEPPPPPIEEVCLALRSNDRVRDALGFFGFKDEWAVNLFKVYEIIGLDAEETVRQRPVSSGEFRNQVVELGWKRITGNLKWTDEATTQRFRDTVHNPDAIGKAARHAAPMKAAPAAPMAQAEAMEWLRGILEQWLRWKFASIGDEL